MDRGLDSSQPAQAILDLGPLHRELGFVGQVLDGAASTDTEVLAARIHLIGGTGEHAEKTGLTVLAATPGREGDLLMAEAVEVTRAGRSGIYDVTVTNQAGELIALMRGHSRTIKGTNFNEEEDNG